MRSAALLLLLAVAATGEDWPCPRGNLANTGVTKNHGPKKKPEVDWRLEEKGTISTGAALCEGKLVYGVGERLVACRFHGDGRTVWDFEVKQRVVAWPAVLDGLIYFGGQDRVHYRVKIGDAGEPESAEAEAAIVADPAVTEEYYLAGATDGYFYAMGSTTGKVLWRKRIGEIQHGAAVARGTTYVVNTLGMLHAFQLRGGRELWQYEGKAKPVAAPIHTKTDVVLALVDKVLTVHAKKGVLGKSYDTKGIAGAPAVDKTLLHYGTAQGEVVTLDLKSGKELQRTKVATATVDKPLVLASKILYGAAGKTLFAVDPKARKLLWTYEGEEPFSPPVVANKAIYVGAGDVFYRLK